MGTFAVCGLPDMAAPYAPLYVPGFAKVVPPYPFRDRGTGTDEELVARRARELRDAILREGPDTVSAVIMEPVLSAGGFIIPPVGWLRAVRAICDELDVLMIADEVITGFGRTGLWFGCEHDGVVPDLLSVAKGITSGYIPLSASVARRCLADVFPETSHTGECSPQYVRRPSAGVRRCPGKHSYPRARPPSRECRASMGARLVEGLRRATNKRRIVGEVSVVEAHGVRRRGPPGARAARSIRRRVAELDRKAWERGGIVYARGSVVRLAPPLCIAKDEVDQLVEIVAGSIGDLERELAS